MTAFPPPTTAPAGWYPDPSGHGMRYFDGRMWAPPTAWWPAQPTVETKPPHPTLPLSAAIWALVILLGSLVVGRSIGSLVSIENDVLAVVLSVLIGYGPSLVWAWHVRRQFGARKSSNVGWSFKWGDLWRGPATYLSTIGVQIGVASVLLLLDVPIASNVEDTEESGGGNAYVVAVVIMAVVAAPIVEEIIFRGVVMRGFLSRMHPVLAIAAQGVLFGCAHIDQSHGTGNIGLAIVLSSVGVSLGGAAYLTRRIGPTVIAHAIFNGVVMLIVLNGWLDDIDRDISLLRVVGAVGVVAGLTPG